MDSVDKNWFYHLESSLRGFSGSESVDRVWEYQTVDTLENHTKIRPFFPQKLLFSATLSQNPEKLASMDLFMPKLFTSLTETEKTAEVGGTVDKTANEVPGKFTTPEGLFEFYVESSAQLKPLIVNQLITKNKWTGVLCFTGEKQSGQTLCKLLKALAGDGIGSEKVGEFSSLLSRQERSAMLKKFSKGKLDILVTSDAMARGIDLTNVNYVICYDCSPFIKTYIHRVGRTARAGEQGTAVSLLAPHEVSVVKSGKPEFCFWGLILDILAFICLLH
jgi:ATP-dependent RNA helicase DDX51/DBP6